MIPLRVVARAAIALVVIGCGAMPSTPSPTALMLALPTVPTVPRVCLGVGGGGATLVGDPADPRVTWLEGSGNRGEIVWPPGYAARFAPDLEVHDASGNVVYREGDEIAGGCAVGPPHDPPSLLLILPEQGA